MPTIGENISKRRKELGLTQEELAERMGYKSKSSINKIEMGINDLPQKKIAAFAKALATSPAALMGWVDDETSKKNDAIAGVVSRMRMEPEFFEVVVQLSELEPEALASVKQMVKLLVKK